MEPDLSANREPSPESREPSRRVQPLVTSVPYSPEAMETATGTSSTTPADRVRGYVKEAVEGFLGDVEVERVRLRQSIEDARRRESRARSVLDMHRVMVSMVLAAHRELSSRRRAAEAAADELLRRADLEAEAMLRAESEPVETTGTNATTGTNETATDSTIDLRGADGPGLYDGRADDPMAYAESSPGSPDEFFAFLRGALDDDRPLGSTRD